MQITTYLAKALRSDPARNEGVALIKIYLMRLVYLLTFTMVGWDSWTAIIRHEGSWNPLEAVAFCVWAAYATLSVLGLFHTLKMLPLLLFQILYKSIWLIAVAYPLWLADQLTGSPAEGLTYAFLWVILPVVAVPWGYVFGKFFWFGKHAM